MSESKRVLALMGSPRKGGNTDVLIDEVLRGAKESCAETSKVYLDKCTIGPCHACDACADTGVCFQRDDMDDLIERMGQSDVWVLGTPVYWWGATAQMKLFIDRWYAPWHTAETKKLFRGRKAIVVVPLAGSESDADPTIGMFERALSYTGIDLTATILAPGVHPPGEVTARTDLMEKAHEAGRSVIVS